MHRDAYTCQNCGLTRGQLYDDGRTVTVHVAHNLADSHGGKPTTENCFTLCARCNEQESNIGPDRPTLSKTMAQVRRSPGHEQRAIFEYLKSVFER
jgi:5-methylcytosine-specific restriction endonuclease McrA